MGGDNIFFWDSRLFRDSDRSYKCNKHCKVWNRTTSQGWVNYSWQKDERLRLVKASANPLWVGEIVHEELKIQGSTSHLDGFIIHYSYRDIDDHFRRTIRYARLSAESYYKKGKKFKLSKMIFSPVIAFIKIYIIKGGFLDGIPGFIAGISAYVYGFLKYAFLWEMHNAGKNKDTGK